MSQPATTAAHGRFRDHLADELRRFRPWGEGARLPWAAAVAVVAAVVLALALHADDPWWAAISAWVCMQPSAQASLAKAGWRMVASLAGAVVGYLIVGLFVAEPSMMHLVLLVMGAVAHWQQMTSRYPYAWLLGAVTAMMVIYAALPDPAVALHVAWYRSVEVALGVLVATVTALLLLPPTAPAASPAAAPPAAEIMRTALATGITLSILPALWVALELPGPFNMYTSVIVLMQPNREAMRWRGLNRLAGCIVGGGLGLLLMALVQGTLLPWLAGMTLGLLVLGHLHMGRSPIAYSGTQAGIAFALATVQGLAPTDTVGPALERLLGILCGLLVLSLVTLVIDEVDTLLRRRQSAMR